MSVIFDKRAFETHLANAEKAERNGNISNAISNYKRAADFCRSLAKEDPTNDFKWETKAATYDKRAADLASGKTTAATAPKKPLQEDKPKSAPENSGDGKPDYTGYSFEVSKPNSDICFADIVGLERAKDEIYDKLVYPLQHPEIYIEKYKLKIGATMLLYGPGGTGKTSFAKAVANELKFPFISTAGSDIIDKYVGETAKAIKSLFKEVRRFIKEQDTPVVLYIDEFDALAKSADSDDKGSDAAVPELKIQMDGFNTDNAKLVIIASTNHIELIDKPIKSRMECIEVPLPDFEARKILIEKKLKKARFDKKDVEKLDIELLAQESRGLSGRDISKAIETLEFKLARRDSGIDKLTDSLNDMLISYFREYRKKH